MERSGSMVATKDTAWAMSRFFVWYLGLAPTQRYGLGEGGRGSSRRVVHSARTGGWVCVCLFLCSVSLHASHSIYFFRSLCVDWLVGVADLELTKGRESLTRFLRCMGAGLLSEWKRIR